MNAVRQLAQRPDTEILINPDYPILLQRGLLAEKFVASVSFDAYSGRVKTKITNPYRIADQAWGGLLKATGTDERTTSVDAFIAALYSDKLQDRIHDHTIVQPDSIIRTLNRHLIIESADYARKPQADAFA